MRKYRDEKIGSRGEKGGIQPETEHFLRAAGPSEWLSAAGNEYGGTNLRSKRKAPSAHF